MVTKLCHLAEDFTDGVHIEVLILKADDVFRLSLFDFAQLRL